MVQYFIVNECFAIWIALLRRHCAAEQDMRADLMTLLIALAGIEDWIVTLELYFHVCRFFFRSVLEFTCQPLKLCMV